MQRLSGHGASTRRSDHSPAGDIAPDQWHAAFQVLFGPNIGPEPSTDVQRENHELYKPITHEEVSTPQAYASQGKFCKISCLSHWQHHSIRCWSVVCHRVGVQVSFIPSSSPAMSTLMTIVVSLSPLSWQNCLQWSARMSMGRSSGLPARQAFQLSQQDHRTIPMCS